MEAINLLNIEMIDISGSTKIHVGNRASETGTLSDRCRAEIIIDDLRYIGWRYQIYRRAECHDQGDRSAQGLHFFRHGNSCVGSGRMSHDYDRTFAAFLQMRRFRPKVLVVQITVNSCGVALLNEFLVENIEPG